MLKAVNDPRNMDDAVQIWTAFVTDLKDQVCWASKRVRRWTFGHIQFNCDFEELGTGRGLWRIKIELQRWKERVMIGIRP